MMKNSLYLLIGLVGLSLISCQSTEESKMSSTATSSDGFDRTHLPMTPPDVPYYTELDARNATAPAPWSVKAPEGAPNVVIVLIDDMGFGVSSAFGGGVSMKTAEKLAQKGI